MKKHLIILVLTVLSSLLGLVVVSCLHVQASDKFSVQYESDKIIAKIHYSEATKDYTPIIDAILDSVEGKTNVHIIFDKGTYHFYPEKAHSNFLHISNNDSGIKKVAFHINGYSSIEIDGGNSSFIFHGQMVPLHISQSRNVSLHHFTIDWDTPFVFEGLVVNNNPAAKSFDLKISNLVKYTISNNLLQFCGYDWSSNLGENIVYNVESKRPYFYTSKYEHDWRKRNLTAKDLGNRTVRLSGTTAEVPPIGSLYVDKGPHGLNRLSPAIFLDQSQNVSVSSINIYHSGAMALIAQKTNKITLYKFNVILAPGNGQMISASADATHFVNCRGEILIDSCRFENMLDDATNVHGTYQVVDSIIDYSRVALSPGHFQQNGFSLFSVGDSIGLVDRLSLKTVAVSTVKKYKVVNDTYFLLETNSPLICENIAHRYVVENLSWKASLTMRNCIVKQNRARAVLVSTTKSVLIENNYFSSMMAGIRICGDANYWFESGEVNQVIIRRNKFEDIGIGGHSPQAVLQIDPILRKDYRKGIYFHRNIVFEKNVIKTFDPLIVYALSVDGLSIKNNEIVCTQKYKPIFSDLSQFDIHHCNHVLIQDNVYKGPFFATVAIDEVENMKIGSQKGFSDRVSRRVNNFFYQD